MSLIYQDPIIDTTFATDPGGGFGSIYNTSGTLTVTYNSSLQSMDFVKDVYQSVYRLLTYNATTIGFFIEVDMEYVASSGSTSIFGVFMDDISLSTNNIITLISNFSSNNTSLYYSSSGYSFNTVYTTINSQPNINVGDRNILRYECWQENNVMVGRMYKNGVDITGKMVSTLATYQTRPSLCFREGTFRIHSLKTGPMSNEATKSLKLNPIKLAGASSTPIIFKTNKITDMVKRPDIFYSGNNVISGKVYPAQQTRVRLVDNKNGKVVASTISDSDGYFVFDKSYTDIRKYTIYYESVDGSYVNLSSIEFTGTKKLAGTYKIRNVPTQNATVKVFLESNNQFIGETTTDSMGYFEMPNLSDTQQFYLVFRDPDGLWEDRVSSRRIPA